MQRIARQSRQYDNPALTGHAELHKALRRALPPSTVNLYASPRVQADSIVEWYSELNGQPVPLAQLEASNPQQTASVRRLLAERLAGVKQVAEHLLAQADSPAQGERLRTLLARATEPPEDKNVYVLDGQPVITAWGIDTPAPQPAIVAPVPVAPRPRRIWPWLLLILALVLAGLLAWLYYRQPEQPPAAPAPVQQPELPPAPEPPPPPPDPIAELRRRIQEAGADCNALLHLHQTEPLLKTHAELRTEFTQQRLTHCRPQMIAEAKHLCPGERLPELTPELAIFIDVTGAMANRPRLNKQGPTFLSATRQALAEVTERLPSDVSAGLVIADWASKARPYGFFPPAQHGQLLRQIQNAANYGDSAPVADQIGHAVNMLDGINRESTLLMVLHDVGKAADTRPIGRNLATHKPRLKINVIVVTDETAGSGRGLADSTGGKFFPAYNLKTLRSAIQQATQDVALAAHCSP